MAFVSNVTMVPTALKTDYNGNKIQYNIIDYQYQDYKGYFYIGYVRDTF